VVEHFKRLCRTLGTLPNIARHYWNTLTLSRMPGYRRTILFSGPEILSIRSPVSNPGRRYIAGADALETWDARQMEELGLSPQSLSAPTPEGRPGRALRLLERSP
jgi:hypothetical protein